MEETKRVYLDNASTTRMSAEVLQAMEPYITDIFGDSNCLHSFGREASNALDSARTTIAKTINAKASEIYFTSGGTEADNLAVRGIAYANRKKGNHIIVSSIEHHAVLDSCKELEKEGFRVTYLPVDENGLVNVVDLEHAIRPDTILVSIMAVNNEVGIIQNIKTIGEIVKEYKAYFHTDATQAMGVMSFDVVDMHIDLLTMSAHTLHGPKGIGALYIKNNVAISKIMMGNEQESNKRGGTSYVAGAVGLAKAVELANRDMKVINKKLSQLSNYFVNKVEYFIPNIRVNGSYQKAPGIVNISFECVDGESVLFMLDNCGIAVYTCSACASGSLEKSYVLKAMGRNIEEINSSVRFSFSVDNTFEEIDYVVSKLTEIIKKLRAISPLKHKPNKVDDLKVITAKVIKVVEQPTIVQSKQKVKLHDNVLTRLKKLSQKKVGK